MKLILALGNPGPQYHKTRHNVGFYMIDRFADTHGAKWQQKPKFQAELAELDIDNERILLAKPTTYYNLVGQTAAAIKQFYKLDNTDILVIHDELALPVGTIRTRLDGGSAGNNGIKSLIEHIGPEFARIRIGIAPDHPVVGDQSDFVLSRLSASETEALDNLYPDIDDSMQHFVSRNHEFKPTSVRQPKQT